MKLLKSAKKKFTFHVVLFSILILLSFSIVWVSLFMERDGSAIRYVQATMTAFLGLIVFLDFRKRRYSARDVENLKSALSFAAHSTRSSDPESIIVQGACRFPGVRGAWLLAEVPGSRVEPLMLASASEEPPPFEKIVKALQDENHSGRWISYSLPRWPGSPPYRIVLHLSQPFSKERIDQMESYAQLAGGYLASGTALREYSVANHRLSELEKEMEIARQRVLREARNSLMGKLVSNIAHELNNPLASVLGSAQLMKSMEKDPGMLQVLDNLLTETRRCKEIVDQVTGLAENSPAEEKRIDLHNILNEVFNLLQYRLRREQIELQKSFCEENLTLQGDEALMNQAFLNLGNLMAEILAASEGQRLLKLETKVEQGKYLLTLRSEPVTVAQNIFDRPGTRLSLWVAGAIFEEYNGKLDSSQFNRQQIALQIAFAPKTKTAAVVPETVSARPV